MGSWRQSLPPLLDEPSKYISHGNWTLAYKTSSSCRSSEKGVSSEAGWARINRGPRGSGSPTLQAIPGLHVDVGQEISITFTGYGFQSAKSFPVNWSRSYFKGRSWLESPRLLLSNVSSGQAWRSLLRIKGGQNVREFAFRSLWWGIIANDFKVVNWQLATKEGGERSARVGGKTFFLLKHGQIDWVQSQPLICGLLLSCSLKRSVTVKIWIDRTCWTMRAQVKIRLP